MTVRTLPLGELDPVLDDAKMDPLELQEQAPNVTLTGGGAEARIQVSSETYRDNVRADFPTEVKRWFVWTRTSD